MHTVDYSVHTIQFQRSDTYCDDVHQRYVYWTPLLYVFNDAQNITSDERTEKKKENRIKNWRRKIENEKEGRYNSLVLIHSYTWAGRTYLKPKWANANYHTGKVVKINTNKISSDTINLNSK